MLEKDILPVVPEQGSVGASGDLAPLAHLALSVMGEGIVRVRGRSVTAREAMRRARIRPAVFAAKEGLALINGVQMSVAVGGLALHRAIELARVADLAGAASLDAARGSDAAFDPAVLAGAPPSRRGRLGKQPPAPARRQRDPRIAPRLRPRPGQLRAAVHAAGPRRGSGRLLPRARGPRAGDEQRDGQPARLRARRPDRLGRELPRRSRGLVLDYAAIAAADLASISERRIEKLTNPALSELPAFLVEEGGINSGLMMAQVAAASLVSENKIHAHPASVDSIPTSADKEDHVSMSPIAARKFAKVVENLEIVLAIELLVAFQAMEFLRPLRSSPPLEEVRRALRRKIPPWKSDRQLSPDIEAARLFLDSVALRGVAATLR